jgi:hypothetical protein
MIGEESLLGSGAISNDVVSFLCFAEQKGLTPWIRHTQHVAIVAAIAWFGTGLPQMANKSICVAPVASRVVPPPAVMPILKSGRTKSYARTKNAARSAALNVLLACHATLSAVGSKKSIHPPSLENDAGHTRSARW